MKPIWIIAVVAVAAVVGVLYYLQEEDTPADQLNQSLEDAEQAGREIVEELRDQ